MVLVLEECPTHTRWRHRVGIVVGISSTLALLLVAGRTTPHEFYNFVYALVTSHNISPPSHSQYGSLWYKYLYECQLRLHESPFDFAPLDDYLCVMQEYFRYTCRTSHCLVNLLLPTFLTLYTVIFVQAIHINSPLRASFHILGCQIFSGALYMNMFYIPAYYNPCDHFLTVSQLRVSYLSLFGMMALWYGMGLWEPYNIMFTYIYALGCIPFGLCTGFLAWITNYDKKTTCKANDIFIWKLLKYVNLLTYFGTVIALINQVTAGEELTVNHEFIYACANAFFISLGLLLIINFDWRHEGVIGSIMTLLLASIVFCDAVIDQMQILEEHLALGKKASKHD